MTRGRGTASIVASPVLVGAVTTLIVIVSVFLAYNANTGLPFVPTYNLKLQLPNGSNLVPGNEVRVGGFRVGIVDKISPGTGFFGGRTRATAIVRMKLDKTVQPLAVDTTALVRPRSALGLKYVQLTPGHSKQTYRDGDTIPLKQTALPVEFDDFLNTFDSKTRQNSQEALTGFGNAFAGRGTDFNEAIQGLAPFFRYLTPVMRNLSDPRTQLSEFFKQIGRANAMIAPVADINAQNFADMADTFAAIGRNPRALQATIEKNPPTQDVSIRSFRVQRPFLADFADLSRRLRPAARVLPTALPAINKAFRVGTPVVKRSVILNRETENVWNALDDLVQDPNTLLGLKDLTALVRSGAPLLQYVAPYQTVCNYGAHFLNVLGSHLSEGSKNGTIERVMFKFGSGGGQEDDAAGGFGDRPSDVPPNVDPTDAQFGTGPNQGKRLYVLHGQPYTPAIDAQGNADCAKGQYGYLDGPLTDFPGRYPAVNGQMDMSPGPDQGSYNSWQKRGDGPDDQHPHGGGGGGHPVTANYPPFLYGPTRNGLRSLQDVDPTLKAHGFTVP